MCLYSAVGSPSQRLSRFCQFSAYRRLTIRTAVPGVGLCPVTTPGVPCRSQGDQR
ncbi:unnamed protein product, partial [Nesidiocoris tenuis]